MPKNEQVTKRLNVEGIDPELFQSFKIFIILNQTTIKEAIIAHIEDYVKAGEKSLEKTSKEKQEKP